MNDKIESIIYDTMDEVVEILPKKINYDKNQDTPLYGGEGLLDSLGLVTFLINLEQKIADEFKMEITIASEKAMSQKNSPFRTVKSLKEYLAKLIK